MHFDFNSTRDKGSPQTLHASHILALWFASHLRNSTWKPVKTKMTVVQVLHYSTARFKACSLFLWQENKSNNMGKLSMLSRVYLCAVFRIPVLNGLGVPPQEQSILNSIMAKTTVLNWFKLTEREHYGCKRCSKFHLDNIMQGWMGA